MKKIILIFLLFTAFANIFAQDYAPGDNEYLFTPTAYTMPKGNSYFTDYELFLLNYTYAVTDRTHLGVFIPFPITTDLLKLLSFGVKQNYLKTDWIQSAVYASYTFDTAQLIFGNSLSIGKPSNGANLSAGITKFFKDSNAFGFLVSFGYRFDPSKNTSLIAEISQIFVEDNGPDVITTFPGGLISVAFRIRSTHLSWDLGAFRSLDMQDAGIIAFPVLKVSYYFF